MKKAVATAAYVAAPIFAAYASYDLFADLGPDYHLGLEEKAVSGLTVFAILTGALWATVAQIIAALAKEQECSSRVNIACVTGFIVGMGSGTWGFAGAMNDMPGWKVGWAFLAGFLGISIFGFTTVFAPSRTLESPQSE